MRVQQTSKKTKEIVSTEIPTIHVGYLLDASGSMYGGKYTNATQGIKNDIKALKKIEGIKYTVSIIEFDSGGFGKESIRIKEHLFMEPIDKIGENVFTPKGAEGGTPLYQASGETIEKLEKFRAKDDKVVLNIFTDGGENTSTGTYANHSTLKALIARVEKDSGFTVTFQGTKGDIDTVVRSIGIHYSNTLSHDNTAKGIATTNLMRTAALQTYSKAVMDGEDVTEGFYTKSIKK